MSIKIHIDEPAEIELLIERDTTPKLDFHIYQDEAQTQPVDVADFTFECYLKESHDTANASSAMSFADGDITKKPDALDYAIRIPITQAQSNNVAELLEDGVILLYWTDSTGHRERLIRGTFEARR